MSARIASAPPPYPEEIQARFDRIMPPGVPPLVLFTTLARDERLFQRFVGGSLLDKCQLPLRRREIVIDRVTARCGSEYEWGVHVTFFGAKAGLTDAHIHSLVHGNADDDCWEDEAERVLIRVCDALDAEATIDETLWRQLSAHFSDTECLEVLMLAGFYRMVSYITNATALPLESYAARFPSKS
jgi:alkylhydroperoxidase family enzyme